MVVPNKMFYDGQALLEFLASVPYVEVITYDTLTYIHALFCFFEILIFLIIDHFFYKYTVILHILLYFNNYFYTII